MTLLRRHTARQEHVLFLQDLMVRVLHYLGFEQQALVISQFFPRA